MADVQDPWTEDFAALGDRSRIHLRSIAATRATVLSTLSTSEAKMRLFKNHPILASLLAIVLLGTVGGAAYAVVDRVILSIDPDKSAPEIENDVKTQLESAGIPATVHADKFVGGVKIVIKPTDGVGALGSDFDVVIPDLGSAAVPGNAATAAERAAGLLDGTDDGEVNPIRIEVQCSLGAEDMAKLQAAAIALPLQARPVGETDADLAAVVTRSLADSGFHDVDVRVTAGAVRLTVKAPPR